MEPSTSLPNSHSEPPGVRSRDKTIFLDSNPRNAQFRSLDSAATDGAAKDRMYFSDWDNDTVDRHIHFLNTGAYRIPKAIPREEEEYEKEVGEETDEETERVIDDKAVSETGTGDEESDEETERVEERADGRESSEESNDETERVEDTGSYRRNTLEKETIQDMAVPEGERSGDMNINMLLVDAELYSATDDKAFKLMALQSLEKRLEENLLHILRGTSNRIVFFIELLEYVYSQTGFDAGPEKSMRGLVLKFTANNFEKLVDRKEIAFLLRKGGDFVAELMGEVSKRLCNGMSCGVKRKAPGPDVRTATLNEVQLYTTNLKVQRPETIGVEKSQEFEITTNSVIQVEMEGLDEQVREFGEKLERLEKKARKLKASNAKKDRELRAARTEIQELQESVRGSNAATAAEMHKLEDSYWRLEEHLQKSVAANVEKIRILEAANAEEKWRLESEVRWLETTVKWFETACPGKAQEFNSANAARIQSLETSVESLENLLKWFKTTFQEEPLEAGATGVAEIQEFETDMVKLQEYEAMNVANNRGFGVTNMVKIQFLETKVQWLKSKLSLFRVAYPEVQQIGRRRSVFETVKEFFSLGNA